MVDKAEIVKIRKSTISHVSTSLKKLENKGLVEKIQSKDNKKHIEIILLDKAELIIEAGHNAQKQFAKNVLSGLTEEKQVCIKAYPQLKQFYSRCGVLWSRGYFVSTVGHISEAAVKKYIEEQKDHE